LAPEPPSAPGPPPPTPDGESTVGAGPETLGCQAFSGRTSATVSRTLFDAAWIRVAYEGVPVSGRYRVWFWPFGRHVEPGFPTDIGRLEQGGSFYGELGPFVVPGVVGPTVLDYNIDLELKSSDPRAPLVVQCDRGADGHPVTVEPAPPPPGPDPPAAPPQATTTIPTTTSTVPRSCEELFPGPSVSGDGSWQVTGERGLYRADVRASFQVSGGNLLGQAKIVWTNGTATRTKTYVAISHVCAAPPLSGTLRWTSENVPATHGHVNCGARYDLVVVDALGKTVLLATLPRVGGCPQ